MRGLEVNGTDMYERFGLRTLKRTVGAAKKDDHTERVPFSSVTYDFDDILGKSYGERTLAYKLEFLCLDKRRAEDRLVSVLEFLHWRGRRELRDPLLPNYRFEVREPTVSFSEEHGVYTFEVKFPAAPEMLPDAGKQYTAASVRFPDIDGSGMVDGVDVSTIRRAQADITAGEPTGLTDDRLARCDANTDGLINGNDVSLVRSFYAEATAGTYPNTPAGWAAFLNDRNDSGKGVI